jgi:hypothetical protein
MELDLLSKNPTFGVNVDVIAKSAGVILALHAIERGIIHPNKIVLIGVPHKWAIDRNHNVLSLMKILKFETLIIQQDEDYMISYDELMSSLNDAELKGYKTLKINGNDHAYLNLEDYVDSIVSFLI